MLSCEQLFSGLLRRFRRAILAGVVAAIASQPVSAQVPSEARWNAIAYAYLNALFVLNLQPIDWQLIEHVLTTDHDGRILGPTASEHLIDLDKAAGTAHWQAIETAVKAQSPDALYAAATRAVSAAIRQHLANAAATLNQPGLAGTEVNQAQSLYRAFAQGLKQTDPESFRSLGLAWLELASSIRQTGLIGTGGLPADEAAFASAQAMLTSYLKQNFEPAAFAPRKTFEPIPEQRALADPYVKLAPWLPPGSDVNHHKPRPRLALRFEEQGVDERNLFIVAYGNMLFSSAEILGKPARSLGIACSTCHPQSGTNQHFFITGISPHGGAVDVDSSFFNARFNDYHSDALDIPSLRGLRFTGPYGRDGRFASLRDFTRHVIVNDFAGQEPTPLVLDALVAYMLEFDFLPASNLDRDGRLKGTVSDAAKRGEGLFATAYPAMHGQSCASCHTPSSHFTDNEVHDIGSAGDGAASGFNGAFDTPTLLGTLYTAPYLHDGRFESLPDVIAWKDETFGLGLSDGEKADLTAYVEAVGQSEQPYQVPNDEATPFQLMVEERLVVLSTLNTLIPDQDRHHADLLLRTVAGEMELDAAALSHRDAREETLALAERLWSIRDLILHDSWDEASLAWQDYQAVAASVSSAIR
ncbi:MAG: cytochrome c peroxidase [Pseudomonadota bacterium]